MRWHSPISGWDTWVIFPAMALGSWTAYVRTGTSGHCWYTAYYMRRVEDGYRNGRYSIACSSMTLCEVTRDDNIGRSCVGKWVTDFKAVFSINLISNLTSHLISHLKSHRISHRISHLDFQYYVRAPWKEKLFVSPATPYTSSQTASVGCIYFCHSPHTGSSSSTRRRRIDSTLWTSRFQLIANQNTSNILTYVTIRCPLFAAWTYIAVDNKSCP